MKSILLASILSIFLLDGSIYDYKITTISEYKKIDLSSFRGKKLLIVNIACKSPYTFQLEELEELKNRSLRIREVDCRRRPYI